MNRTSFTSKFVRGGKLYFRKHGFASNEIAPGQTGNIDLIVPYNLTKINEVEFTNCAIGDCVNFKVYDDPTGSMSGEPGLFLNQYGFDVRMPNGFYRELSSYEADLVKDMKITIEYKNNSSESKIIYGNIIYHEVK